MNRLNVVREDNSAILPTYGTEFSAGLDLYTPVDLFITPNETVIVDSKISLEIPEGHYGLMGPRSGWAIKRGLIVKNAPAIIDCDYRGTLKVALLNISFVPISVLAGDRIAQIAIVPYTRVQVQEVEKLSDTVRGSGGLGSTG